MVALAIPIRRKTQANQSGGLIVKRIRNRLFAAALFATLPATDALAANPSPGSAPVNIVSPLPLPVTGNIALQPGGSVTIANSPGNPVPVQNVDARARQPFAMTATDFVGSPTGHCGAGGCILLFPAVPDGMRMVITQVAARFVSFGGKKMYATDLVTSSIPGPGAAELILIPSIVPPNSELGATWSVIAQPAQGFVEASATPEIEGELDGGNPGDRLTATITGYFVSLP
jgi:hypothetical protein